MPRQDKHACGEAGADWRHFGRLAGFTNPKRERRLPSGMRPFARLRSATGRVYSNAAEFIVGIATSRDGEAGRARSGVSNRAGAGGNARESGDWGSFTPIRPTIISVTRSLWRYEKIGTRRRSRGSHHKALFVLQSAGSARGGSVFE